MGNLPPERGTKRGRAREEGSARPGARARKAEGPREEGGDDKEEAAVEAAIRSKMLEVLRARGYEKTC